MIGRGFLFVGRRTRRFLRGKVPRNVPGVDCVNSTTNGCCEEPRSGDVDVGRYYCRFPSFLSALGGCRSLPSMMADWEFPASSTPHWTWLDWTRLSPAISITKIQPQPGGPRINPDHSHQTPRIRMDTRAATAFYHPAHVERGDRGDQNRPRDQRANLVATAR